MCLWFACFGLHKHDDDSYAPPNRGLPPAAATKLHHGRRNGYGHGQQGAYYGNGAHQTAAGAEAGRKASNDVRKGPAAPAAVAKYAPEKASAYTGAAEALKQPAWNGRVAGEAAHGAQQQHYYYYEREPVHKEAAMDYHYSTATATAGHERY